MEIEVYASDPFTAKKESLLTSFTSDYRFQKGDEMYIHEGEDRPLKVRIIDVRIHVREGGRVTSELLALKL